MISLIRRAKKKLFSQITESIDAASLIQQSKLLSFLSNFEKEVYNTIEKNHSETLKLTLETNENLLLTINEIKWAAPSLEKFYERSEHRIELWHEINSHLSYWKNCDIIFSCPLTSHGAKIFFPSIEIIEVSETKQLNSLLTSLQEKRIFSIGIISSWLIEYLCHNQSLLNKVSQICKGHLLAIINLHNSLTPIELRRTFHQTGFYEIAIPSKKNNSESYLDFSSVGIFPDGNFDLTGTQPGLPNKLLGSKTYIISRFALNKNQLLTWQSTSGSANFTEDKECIANPETFALCIKERINSSNLFNEMIITAEVKWQRDKVSHASLISCYTGPGDSNMYAALIENSGGSTVSVSLWRHYGEWQRLATTAVNGEMDISNTGPSFILPLWLQTTTKSVIVGTANETLLSVPDQKLPRIGHGGIRLFSDGVSLSKITVDCK